MKNWDDLKFCHALYRHGTMSDAAKVLNTNVATVSRRLHRLSEEVGETLFIKEGNRWAVTEAGAELARIAEQFRSQIHRTGAADREPDLPVLIRISCAMQLLQCGIVDGLTDYLAQHPHVSFRFETLKRSLALNECDIRLGFEEPNDGRIVRRLFRTLELVPACAQPFADRIEGWVNVLFAERTGPQSQILRGYFGAAPRVEVEGMNVARSILRTAPLVAPLGRSLVAQDPGLTEVTAIGSLGSLPVWLSYHESRRRDPAVRLAVQFLERSMRPEETRQSGAPAK